ncbi:MAG: hypothetical protein V3V20_08715 [Algisphaera sp.]
MKHLRYLNSVLTVIAILLTLSLYTQLTSPSHGPVASFATPAHAAERAKGVGSQAARQEAMVKSLESLVKSVDQLNANLTNGSARVQVENFPAAE